MPVDTFEGVGEVKTKVTYVHFFGEDLTKKSLQDSQPKKRCLKARNYTSGQIKVCTTNHKQLTVKSDL